MVVRMWVGKCQTDVGRMKKCGIKYEEKKKRIGKEGLYIPDPCCLSDICVELVVLWMCRGMSSRAGL